MYEISLKCSCLFQIALSSAEPQFREEKFLIHWDGQEKAESGKNPENNQTHKNRIKTNTQVCLLFESVRAREHKKTGKTVISHLYDS